MKRLVIAVDCDDVLVVTTPFFVDSYNARYGTSVQLAEAHGDTAWGVERPILEERLGELLATDEYRELAPSEETITVLRALAKDHELHVVTARREGEAERTQRMLDTFLPGIFMSLEHVGWHGSKGEVCQRIGASVLIDDSPRHLYNALELGLPAEGAILFGDYPWVDTTGVHEDIRRCADWRSVKEVIDQLAREGR